MIYSNIYLLVLLSILFFNTCLISSSNITSFIIESILWFINSNDCLHGCWRSRGRGGHDPEAGATEGPNRPGPQPDQRPGEDDFRLCVHS
jgi:hypothetical protein